MYKRITPIRSKVAFIEQGNKIIQSKSNTNKAYKTKRIEIKPHENKKDKCECQPTLITALFLILKKPFVHSRTTNIAKAELEVGMQMWLCY